MRLVAALCLLLTGCAHGRLPLRLQLATPELRLVAGESQRLEVVLANPTRQPVRVQRDGSLQYGLECRREGEPPGQRSLGSVSAMGGSVWGGVTDSRPDPDDPKYCREYPPETMVLAPGERLTLATVVEVPAECVGEADLDIYFESADDGRHCPGIAFGETRTLRRRVEIRPPGG